MSSTKAPFQKECNFINPGHSFVFKDVESKKAKLQLCICQVPSPEAMNYYFSYDCYHLLTQMAHYILTHQCIYPSPTPQKKRQLTVSESKLFLLRLCGQQLHGCINTIQWSPYSPGNLLAAGRKGGEGAWCVVEGDDGDDDDDDDVDDDDDDDVDGGISLSAFMWLCVSFCEVFAFQGDVGHPDVSDATASWLTTCFAVCVGWNLGPSRMNVWDKIRSCSTCVCVCVWEDGCVDMSVLIFHHCSHTLIPTTPSCGARCPEQMMIPLDRNLVGSWMFWLLIHLPDQQHAKNI